MSPFTPARLFRAGELGAWLDPSDRTLMFQDSAGQAAAVVGQPVGLILDKSQALALRHDIMTNGGFSSGTTGWSSLAGIDSFTVTGGVATVDNGSSGAAGVTQTLALTVGKTYKATAQVRSTNGLAVRLAIQNAAGDAVLASATDVTSAAFQSSALYFTATETNSKLYLRCVVDAIGEFDNITCQEIAGAHAMQGTAAARPSLVSGGKIDYDAIDDALVITWPSSLGTNCTVARAVSGTGTTILTGQTITTSYSDNTDHCGLVIVNRALTASETAGLTRYLNKKAGV